jgi:phosphatidyl-myo-inositol dimannoside synthase
MRLMIITFDPPENVGGIEARALGYSRHLSGLGIFVEVVALAPGYGFSDEKKEGFGIRRYPSGVRDIPRVLRAIVRDVSADSIDSIFLLSGGLTLLGQLVLLYARLIRVRSVILFYGKDILVARHSISRIFLYTAPLFSSRVAVNSAFTGTLVSRSFSSKLSILYPSVDPGVSAVEPPLPARDGRLRILFVGRLVERKGVDDLLMSLAQLAKDMPDALLEVVGDGPDMNRLKELAKALGVQDSVIFFGTLRGRALYERFAIADVVAMPSRMTSSDVEGFGTVFLEAAAFGKPSIGTRSGGIPEAIIEGESGLLVGERDTAELLDALRRMLSDPALRARMGQNAAKRVCEFDWEHGVARLLEMFNDSRGRSGN